MTLALRDAPSASAAGRLCPADYRYSPRVFDRPVEFETDILYVAGGLYGNLAALDAIEKLAAQEQSKATIVFNGDFHWFDADRRWFSEIERRVTPHLAIRGNVETEIARHDDIGAGCGCAYPEAIDDNVVTRSNLILDDLRDIAGAFPDAQQHLRALPMHLVGAVGNVKVAIVHGDAWSLAGWNFSHDQLDDPSCCPRFDTLRHDANTSIFACTHTCLAALRDFATPDRPFTVINNGAAGMPNFGETRYGLISRIATRPSPHQPLYGLMRDGVSIDAIALPYDHAAFLEHFLRRWPEGSSAHASYFGRITNGPDYRIAQAQPRSGPRA